MNLEQKQDIVEELVKKNHLPIEVGPIHSAALDKHYRNKVIVAFAKHKGRVYAGQYAPHSHRVIKDGGRSLQGCICDWNQYLSFTKEYDSCS